MLRRLASKTKKRFLMVHFSYLSYPQNVLLQNVLLLNIHLKIRPVYKSSFVLHILYTKRPVYKTSFDIKYVYKMSLEVRIKKRPFTKYTFSDFTSKDVIIFANQFTRLMTR
jgi:hypothetical protein